MNTETDIVERMSTQAADGVDFHGETMKQWDKIRAECARRDGSDLPRLMFEGLVESFADLLTEGAAEITKLRAERDAAVENVLAIIDPWTRGAFTGWTGQSGLSKITLDEAEDHFSLCMVDMKNDVRTKLGAAAPFIATDRKDAT